VIASILVARLGRAGLSAVLVAGAFGAPAQAVLHRGAAGWYRDGSPARLEGGPAAAGVISTVAGGPGGPARGPRVSLATAFDGDVSEPCGLAYGAGRLYIGDMRTVRAVNPATGWLTTPAGTGAAGPLGEGGPAAKANVNACGVAVDPSGNLVITDTYDNRIRVVAAGAGTFYGQAMKAGHIYSIAGDGRRGFSGDGGPATTAKLNGPTALVVDSSGNLVITDASNNRVRVVAEHTGTFYGQAMTAGDIYTIAGDGAEGFSGDGGPAISAELGFPQSAAVDAAGNVLIADRDNNRVRVVAEHTGTFYGQAMTAGDIYTIAGDGNQGFSGDGGPATSAELNTDSGVMVDGSGNVVFTDDHNNRVQVVAEQTGTFYGQAMTAGDVYSIAGDGTAGDSGDGGPATAAEMNSPDRVAVDGAGNLVIAEWYGERVRVVAASTGTFYGQVMTAGDIYTIAGNSKQEFSGDGGPATRAELNAPQGVAVDGAGNMLITDTDNNRIRVVAASTGTFYGRAMTAGHIYSIVGDGRRGFSGDGGPATRAELNGPTGGVAVDGAGNLVITDASSNRIQVVAEQTGTFYGQAMTAQDIYTIAGDGHAGFSGDGIPATSAELSDPQTSAVDAAGNVLIADRNNFRIRVVAEHTGTFYGQAMTAGDIYTIAGDGTEGFSGDGGPATSAELNIASGITVDGSGNVVFTDDHNNRVQVVAEHTGTFYGQAMTAGDIYSIAGDGTAGDSGDGGPATAAEMNSPDRVAVDSAGNIVIAEWYGERVRVVAASTGTFYGQVMTAGDIYTIAGDSKRGFSGDGGPATSAQLNTPAGLAVDSVGNVLIADSANNRIRMIPANLDSRSDN
jgi:trimeric autotransporter adhesin